MAGQHNAMTAAATDDTILVSPGVYKPFAIGLTKTLTVKSLVEGAKYTFDAGGNTINRVIELAVGVGLTLEDAELRNNKQEYGNQSGIWPTAEHTS